MAYNEPIDEVLAHYPLHVNSVRVESYKQKKGVWWIDSDIGMLILKKAPNSEATVKFLLAAIRHLQKNGINIPQICNTKEGNPYVVAGTSCFILMEAVTGKNPVYKSEDLELYVRELGKFHRASLGFAPPLDCKIREHLGHWPEIYRRQIGAVQELFDQESQLAAHNSFGETFLKEYPYFVERMQRSLVGLEGPLYSTWVEKVRVSGGLCHQDFAAGNVLIGNSGQVHVLDTDSLTIDMPARDIRKVLNKMMKKDGAWDEQRLENVMRWYQQENPLTAQEWQVVKMDLTYPHLFVGSILKYYKNKEEDWQETKYLSKLVDMVNVEKSFDAISDKYDTIVDGLFSEGVK